MKRLLIDSIRDFKTLGIDSTRDDYIATSYLDGVLALKNSVWDILYLDHDLKDIKTIAGKKVEKTGYDVMCWLASNPQFLPKRIVLVAHSSIGRHKMQKVIDRLYLKEKIT
jgi:hypothetical protein